MKGNKVLYYVIMILLFLSVIEIFLQTINYVMPNGILSDIDPIIKDKVLGHRPNPKNPEHDQNGFRNKTIPPHPNIIVLGDSQTYGVGVHRDDAWPQQLAGCTGLKVYNMAFGGWGPVHYLLLLPEAIAKKPKIILEAFYAGNDLCDSFTLVHKSRNRLDFLKTTDKQTLEKIAALERQETIDQMASEADINVASEVKSHDHVVMVKSFLRDHVKIYRLFSFAKKKFLDISFEDKDKTWAQLKAALKSKNQQNAVIVEQQNIRTILTPTYRLAALNLDDARISEGLDISLKTFRMMRDQCAAAGIRFYVVMIPTKESVFSVVAAGSPNLKYQKLVKNERLMWEKSKEFLQVNNIACIDAQSYLQYKLLHGIQPYFINEDGHPNKYGHQAIAAGVCKVIKKNLAALKGRENARPVADVK